ncbi:hypothetical protein J4234_03295 [Candidatus Woesearchaeota archaeon]|nr:hypothetical protein [Candidatus Woesearchaeota archaeon]
MAEIKDKYILIGLSASGLLLLFYFIVSSLLGGFQFAVDNFIQLWYWMVPLVVGFGIQMGMFFYVKNEMHKKAAAEAAASTGISTGAMVACCAHHIADIAPFLGITALGIFLTKYQSTFLLIGMLSNILGVTYMFTLMETKIPRRHLKALFYSLLVVSIAIAGASYFFVSKSPASTADSGIFLQPLTDSQNSVDFQVKPLSASQFDIEMNTHSVALDFDLIQISTLYDNLGNSYKPLHWEGSEPGGHHRSGTLKFPQVDSKATLIKLVITDSAKREFSWNLK